MVGRALADPAVVPLIGHGATIERAYSLASVLATEGAIADTLARSLTRRDAAACAERVGPAIAAVEADLGCPLSDEQRQAAEAICSSGRGAELVVGVAGSGKTTMLAAVATAYRAAGCEVVGAATAGQAARALGVGAHLERSSTLASLTGQLDRGTCRLGERSVVILDEVGMTDDVDLARLLAHVEAAGAKLVAVGDHRQLGAVGPGGALAALVTRHPDAVHHLLVNRRQTDPGERAALDQLREGEVAQAVAWYAERERIQARPDRERALQAAVEAWAADVAAGADSALLAWRRANVTELNGRARAWMSSAGRLSGPEVVTADGARYRAGDHLVALAPDRDAGLVTSQRTVAASVDPAARTVTVDAGDGRRVTLTGDQLSAHKLGYAYATTVHRCQGATVDQAHLFADGGGRELAYVAMSRARDRSTAWVVADDAAQAAEDLTRDWASRRTPTWALDTGLPDPHHLSPQVAGQLGDDQRDQLLAIAAARGTTTARAATGPARPEPPGELADTHSALAAAQAALADLPSGAGAYQGTVIGDAVQDARQVPAELGRLQWASQHAERGRQRRQAARQLPEAAGAARTVERRAQALVKTETDRLGGVIADLEDQIAGLEADHQHLTRRWQGLAQQRAAAAGNARRFGRLLDQVRHRLDRPSPAEPPTTAPNVPAPSPNLPSSTRRAANARGTRSLS